MAIPQQKFREIVFQLIYSYDLSHSRDEDIAPFIMKELAVTRKSVREAQVIAKNIQSLLGEIDELIAKTSTSYAFERIQTVERNILRLGVYELIYQANVPPKVAISESMRLARKFGTLESAAFVNALLDSIYKSSQGIQSDANNIAQSVEDMKKSEAAAEEVSKLPLEPLLEDDD
jgi:transcription antitermination protein NusB